MNTQERKTPEEMLTAMIPAITKRVSQTNYHDIIDVIVAYHAQEVALSKEENNSGFDYDKMLSKLDKLLSSITKEDKENWLNKNAIDNKVEEEKKVEGEPEENYVFLQVPYETMFFDKRQCNYPELGENEPLMQTSSPISDEYAQEICDKLNGKK